MAATANLTAQGIIFAINSAIKLSHNIRRAYAQSIRGKALALPLPDFNTEIKFNTIRNFFNDHGHYPREIARLGKLHEDANLLRELPEEQFKEYKEFYCLLHALHLPDREKRPEMNAGDMINLFRIRQWENGSGHETVLQLVAGSLVEIGIDYFIQTPGALNVESAQGRILFHFLSAFDEIDFSESKDIKLEASQKLVPRLFAAAAESFAELSPEIAEDPKLQLFIKETAKGITNDLYRRFKELDREQREEATNWGQLVLRSMINNAGTFVFKSPEALFNTNKPVSDIIQSTGLALLDAILGSDTEDSRIQWRNAISADTLNGITRASMQIVAEHPNFISGNQGIQAIVSEVANAVEDKGFQKQGLIPELARIVLEQSAGNMELLWRPGANGPEHLLVSAVKQLLGILSQKHGDAPWRPVLTKANLLGLVYELLDEAVQNPSWVTDKANQDSILAEVLDITFSSLSRIPKEARLTAETIRWLIRLNMQAVLTSRKVLEKIEWPVKQENADEDSPGSEMAVILDKALELAFTCIFPQDAGPNINRMELMAELTEYILDVVLRQHPGRRGLVLIDLILFDSGVDLSEGLDRELLDELLDAAFDTLSNHPELLARHEGLKHILAGVAGSINSAKLNQPGLLPFLVQLLLEHTAQNANLVINAGQDEPQHLLTIALKHILTALSNQDSQGNWRPEISPLMAQTLIEDLLEETVAHPFWINQEVNGNPLLAEMLDATFAALAQIPKDERLAPGTLETLVQLNLKLVAASPQVLGKIAFAGDSQEKAILGRALDLVFAFVFHNQSTTGPGRIRMLQGLLDYILSVVMAHHPNKRGLILADLILFDNNGIDYTAGFNEELAEQLVESALTVLAQQPELVTHGQALKAIVGDAATALKDSGISRPELLPELIRLTLHYTGEHLGLVFDPDQSKPEHLLVLASREVLKAIAEKPRSGKWKPRLSNNQIAEALEIVFEAVVEYPQWIQAEEVVYEVLDAIFRAMEVVSSARKLPYVVFRHMLESALEAARRQRQFIVKIQTQAGGRKQIMLRYSLESLFMVIYDENGEEESIWRLSQAEVITGVIDYFLLFISETPGSKEDVDRALDSIRAVISAWKQDLSQTLDDVLETLENENT